MFLYFCSWIELKLKLLKSTFILDNFNIFDVSQDYLDAHKNLITFFSLILRKI